MCKAYNRVPTSCKPFQIPFFSGGSGPNPLNKIKVLTMAHMSNPQGEPHLVRVRVSEPQGTETRHCASTKQLLNRAKDQGLRFRSRVRLCQLYVCLYVNVNEDVYTCICCFSISVVDHIALYENPPGFGQKSWASGAQSIVEGFRSPGADGDSQGA